MATEIRIVDDAGALQQLGARLASLDRVGLDTEFHAEHRYLPDLMLVQIAEPEGPVWLVDARRLHDLSPLRPMVERVQLVVHGGQQDIALMRRATGAVPTRILDTQRAAAFLGLGFPTRLGLIARQVLGTAVDKSAGLSDWSARPLSPRQQRYAAEDAVLMTHLAAALEQQLGELDRWRWALEASHETVDEALAEPDDAGVWLSWDIAHTLEPVERRVIHALMTWRETAGRDLNQQPRSILSDGIALDLARRRPASPEELAENRRMPSNLTRRHGRALVDVVRSAVLSDVAPPEPATPDQLQAAAALDLWAGAVERSLNIARTLLMPRSLAIDVASQGIDALTGWRAEVLAAAGLQDFLQGRSGLGLSGGRTTIWTR